MYVISKEFAWSASHVLTGLPDGHPCGRLHGHNYVARVTLARETLDEAGFVVDYGALAPVKEYIDSTLDHRHLNDVLVGVNPTAENLAHALTNVARSAVNADERGVSVSVAVSETPKTWASYYPEASR